jgi:hypothetical protein
MNGQVTLQVPEHIMLQVAQANQKIENVFSDIIVTAFGERPVTALNDAELLSLAESRLTSNQEERLNDLLAHHGEGLLDPNQQRELDQLMNVYERALLRQSQALREAVARGLMKPLSHEQN